MTGTDTPADILPFVATETTLSNGLRVIVVPTGFPNLVSLQIPVQTGSRNEVEPGKSGFAHFFEHMMFRGTKRYPAHVYQEIVARAGARQNAYTTDDYTNYHMTFAAEDLETMLEVEADRFQHLEYSEEDFKTEARAVLGEYNKSASNPLTKLFEVQREHAFRVHPYRHTTMGFLADIEAMPDQFDYSRLFFDRWYRPEYTTILVAGDVDPRRVTDMVERHWGDWKRGSHTVDIPQEPPPGGPVLAHVPWNTPTLPWVTVAFHAPAMAEDATDFAALDLLLDLSFGETSDLYRRLVEREQVVDQLMVYYPPRRDPTLATVLARARSIEKAEYVRDAIIETVRAVRQAPPPHRRLDEARSHNRYAFARMLDNSESIAAALASFVHFRRSYHTLNNLFRQYDRATTEDLARVAGRYLTDEGMVITTLSHEPLPSRMTSPPSVEAAPAVDLTDVPFVVQPSPVPLVRMKLLFQTGSARDPQGKEGLAALASAMIAEAGSRELRIDEINRALFPIAGTFSARVDREMTTFTGVAHRDTLDRFMEVALPQLLDPGFREEDFTRLKQRQRNALVQDLRSANEEELAKELLQARIFAGTPYGHTVLGTVSAIDAISLEDVRDFVRKQYTQANLMVGLAGDAPGGFEETLRARLAALPEGTPQPPLEVRGRMPAGIEIEIVAKESRSTAISLGHPIAVTRSHPDFAALWLARAWLGEHRASHGRLFQRIRELRGLNYGDYAYIEAFPGGMYQFFPEPNLARRAQLFEIWIRPVVPAHAVFTLKLALYELRRLIEHGIAPAEFEATRNYLAKNVFVMTKTQDQQLGYALDSRWYGIGDFVRTMREQLAALTVDQVNAAIRRHLSGENLLVIMVAGDAEALRSQLLGDAPATVTYDAPKPAELLAEDEIVAALPLGLTPGRVKITPVDDVFRA